MSIRNREIMSSIRSSSVKGQVLNIIKNSCSVELIQNVFQNVKIRNEAVKSKTIFLFSSDGRTKLVDAESSSNSESLGPLKHVDSEAIVDRNKPVEAKSAVFDCLFWIFATEVFHCCGQPFIQ